LVLKIQLVDTVAVWPWELHFSRDALPGEACDPEYIDIRLACKVLLFWEDLGDAVEEQSSLTLQPRDRGVEQSEYATGLLEQSRQRLSGGRKVGGTHRRGADLDKAAFEGEELLQVWFLRHLQIIGGARRALP